jgi:hypothetical protein
MGRDAVEDGQMAFLYHATNAINLPSILDLGLTPNFDRDPSWDGYPVNGRLYVASTEDAAEFYAETLSGMYGWNIEVLRCPASIIKTSADEYGNPDDKYTNDTVSPEHLEVRRDNTWVALTSLPSPAGSSQAII